MATFDISIPGVIGCCDTCSEIQPGHNLSLTVDTVKYPGFAGNPISALVNTIVAGSVYDPDTNTMVPGNTYNVTVSDSDMPVVDAVPLTDLDITDVIFWECESCCVELEARVEVLEAPITVIAGSCAGDGAGGTVDIAAGSTLNLCSSDGSISIAILMDGSIDLTVV